MIKHSHTHSIEFLEQVTNGMSQGIVVFGESKLELVTNSVKGILEVPDERVQLGSPWINYLELLVDKVFVLNDEDPQDIIDAIVKNIKTRTAYQAERATKNGQVIRIDAVPFSTHGMIFNYTDITESKLREKNLERTSRLLQATTDAMVQGIVVFNADTIDFFNPQAADMLQLPADVLCEGKSWIQFLEAQRDRGDFGENSNSSFQEILNCIKSRTRSRVERKISDGRTIKVDGVPSGENGWIISYTDISTIIEREAEIKAAMLIAESAERAKSEFLANMSHEIRTPMNGVMGMAELLATTELDSKQKMFTDVIVKSGASLLTIINDILDFSKIDAGQMELDPAPFALAEAIEDVATLVSSKVAEKDLELIVRVDPALPKMMVGDVGRIRQIVTNLLGNAVKFTENGHVFVNIEGSVRTEMDGKIASLKVSIEDTGIGIPKEQCEKVFQKFSQVDTSATRKHEGTGLGLSISSSLVRLMGGEIGVKSDVGHGSTFWFTAELPVHGESERKHVVPGDMTGARVLVIDDNEVNRSILAEQLAAWNFDAAAARSGREGLEIMRAVKSNNMSLDLIILDYQMPEMSGEEVLEALRADDVLKDIPVVMLTSVDSAKTNKRLAQLGAEANLTKPARSSMLLETILQVIANKRADVTTRSISNLTAKQVPQNSHNNHDTIISGASDQQQPSIMDNNQQLDVLVAEDNEVNQIVFRQILEETGLSFKIVGNGRLAYATYKIQQPRLILMDISMPEMNGKEATVAIRKYEREEEIKHTPIVGVTAHALKGDMEACIDAGMDDYLSKPVSPKKLSLKIEQWLKVDLRKVS